MFEKVPHNQFPEKYDICQKTGLCFYKPAKIREYKNSYFLEEYKQQYKKTYYEDESMIRELSKKRLEILTRFYKKDSGTLLEIGSAAGFFLDEARQRGFEVTGIEISKSEVNFAQRFGLDVIHGSFIEQEFNQRFDIICAFFVLEHFFDQELILNKIFSLLKEDGFLFLSLPSLHGPTFETDTANWFINHPEDHFVDYSPESIEKVLGQFQTSILYRCPMSYHPQRDKNIRGQFPMNMFYKFLADLDCYGDTMQILARRNL